MAVIYWIMIMIVCILVIGVLKKPGPGSGIDPLAGIGITGFFPGFIPARDLSRNFEAGIPAGFGIFLIF
jgi:preprotein translocase subunit SecG